MKALFGYGNTTKAIAKSGGWEIYDDKFETVTKDEYGNTLLPSKYFTPQNSSLQLTSPGISPSHFLIKKANNLMSDYDYFYDDFPMSVWITGSNGKTTTTQMIEFLLPNSQAGGNIGVPIANMDKNKIWVLETSSFTLHYTKKAKPNIFVLLPITPDHISWHGSFEAYEQAKLSPLQRMDERDIAIIPKKYKNYPTSAYTIYYENVQDIVEYFQFTNIIFKHPFTLDEVLAKAVYKILFFEEKSLSGFSVDSHKIEEFYDLQDRLWVDDSKATNVDATIQALKRYKDKKIYLILGGDSKEGDLKPLFEELKNYAVELFLIGKDMHRFAKMADKYKMLYHLDGVLQNSVQNIAKKLKKGEVALLSPASASLDQFQNYKQRGEKFKNYIHLSNL